MKSLDLIHHVEWQIRHVVEHQRVHQIPSNMFVLNAFYTPADVTIRNDWIFIAELVHEQILRRVWTATSNTTDVVRFELTELYRNLDGAQK